MYYYLFVMLFLIVPVSNICYCHTPHLHLPKHKRGFELTFWAETGQKAVIMNTNR